MNDFTGLNEYIKIGIFFLIFRIVINYILIKTLYKNNSKLNDYLFIKLIMPFYIWRLHKVEKIKYLHFISNIFLLLALILFFISFFIT